MLQDDAKELFDQNNSYGLPLKNHCLRLAEFTLAVGNRKEVPMDRDLVYAICYLHDIGLLVRDPTEKDYLKRGLKFSTEALLNKWTLSKEQNRIFKESMLYNHSMVPVAGLTPQVECLRLAVQVEHSIGIFSRGVPKEFIDETFKKYPRKGFNTVLWHFFVTSFKDGGPKGIYSVFFPSKDHSPE